MREDKWAVSVEAAGVCTGEDGKGYEEERISQEGDWRLDTGNTWCS